MPLVPLLWLSFIANAGSWPRRRCRGTRELALVLSAGLAGGFGINLGHELGHKNTKLERWLAKIISRPPATATSSSSTTAAITAMWPHRSIRPRSHMGETIYGFVLREMPGACARLGSRERAPGPAAGPSGRCDNEVLQPLLITVLLYRVLIGWASARCLFLLTIAFWGNFQLTFGQLHRALRPAAPEAAPTAATNTASRTTRGTATTCSPTGSLFHLQRHSDHHAHPTRRYQSLRHFDNVPQLPNGYVGMFLACYIPPLWFRLMDRRVVAWADGDASRIHFQSGRRDALVRRHGMHDSTEAA